MNSSYDSSFFYYFLYLKTSKWERKEEEQEVMEAVWMQVKGACEKLKGETNAQNEHIRKMLWEMTDCYYIKRLRLLIYSCDFDNCL